ncbi:MAG TPA: GYD domain-containing protein [Chloroflexota bacterium]|nr:GYD domain-containing protein [Chloroflexota bacterium]
MSKRRAAAEQAAKSVGGKIESFYFAFGGADAFVIADVPDHASASAVSLAVSASGGAHCKTIVLMTPEEVDASVSSPFPLHDPLQAPGHPAMSCATLTPWRRVARRSAAGLRRRNAAVITLRTSSCHRR